MGKTSASFEKSSGVLTKSWGQFWATARGSSWKSHANCLGHFGHFLGHSLGEIRKICGREPGPFLGAIFDDCPEEFLGKFWEVMGRSWPNPGGILGRSTMLLNPSKNVSTAKAEQNLGAFLGDCLGEF